jgi:undecaprenyl-diphosphatase
MFLLVSVFLHQGDKKKFIPALWVSAGVSTIISYIVKIIVQRPRPFNLGIVATFPSLAKNSYLAWDSSFPSSHAMLAFCSLPFISKEFPKLKYLWILFAILIAFSRVYFGLHFLSDVLAGGLLGYFIGWFILNTEEENKFSNKILKRIKKLWKKVWKKI